MAITETETVTLANVEVGDDYRVHVTQMRKRLDYTPRQALQLSVEIAQAALEAMRMLDEDVVEMSGRLRSYPTSEVL